MSWRMASSSVCRYTSHIEWHTHGKAVRASNKPPTQPNERKSRQAGRARNEKR